MIREASLNDHAATTILLASHWLRDHPDDFFVMLDYAEMLYQMTRYGDAIRIYERALETEKDDSRRWAIFNQMGRMYQYWGRPADAESWFRRAIESNPDEVCSYMFLGACQARQGKLMEAEATHRAATQLKQSNLLDEAYQNLGLVLRGQGRLAEAAECFRKAIEIDPQYSEAATALVDVEKAMTLFR